MKIGIFDFEATDKNTDTARITQGAINIYDQGREVYHYSALVFEENYEEINETAAAITGITREQLVSYGVHPKDFFNIFLKALGYCDVICGHNIRSYDLPLLSKELTRQYEDLICIDANVVIDTRMDILFPEHIETRKLQYLAAEYGYANPMAHSARHDVDATAFLLFKFDLDQVISRSKSPDIMIRADVSFDNKDLAKERKFGWDSTKKIWVKNIKECDLEKELSKCKFNVIRL